MYKRVLLFILLGISVSHVMAQKSFRAATNAITSSNTVTGKFYFGNQNDPPRAIEFKEGTITASHFLDNINHYFNIPAEFTFAEAESNTDHLGMRHHLLQQYYKGIPLEGMGYRVHEKNGFVTSANGKAVRDIDLDTEVSINEAQAFHLAIKHIETKDTVFRQSRKLIVSKGFVFTPESFSIAFQFDIDVSLIEQWRISIDARTGQVINKVSLVNTCFEEPKPPLPYGTGTGVTNYYGTKTIRVEKFDGGSSRLHGQTENGGMISTYSFENVSVLSLALFFEFHKAYDIYSSNDIYNNAYHKPAVSAQWAMEQAYEYYFKKHNRNSFDNKGSAIKSYVHVDQNMNNAFWTHNLLAFGDGNNNNPLVELDVVSHELTHGVTQYEAGLQYYNESGALNESFSDILGKAVEFNAFGDTATWQLARHNRAGGLRDMSNPNLKNNPDTYMGDMWYTGYEDNGGIHTNSGVQNFWFYLLCKGGSGVNDHQASYSINAIGLEAAAKVVYRNLTEYLSNTSDYLDARIGSLLAAADLYGKNSAVYQEVDKAWDAVGVIDEPIVTGIELYDITATTVKIKGSFLPRGDTVAYHFEYGTTPAFGSSSSIYEYKGKVEGIVRGLQSKTKYYLRLVATNENGSSYGPATEFTTISLAPLVKIKQTVDVTETTAILYGEINPNSLQTSFYFEYGLTPSFGLVTSSFPLSDTTEFLNVSASVTNLQPRQTYYYRLVATNGFSSSATEAVNFFTAMKPVINSYTPATATIGTEITITGQNFNSDPEKNLVSFGATRAIVLASSSTEIKVKVPVGASLGPISLLEAESGLTTQSVREFVPTYTGEFKKGDLHLSTAIKDIPIWQALVQDMDGDGKPDIVARHSPGFSVFLNVNQGGDITRESFVRNTSPVELNGQLYLVDFDGNGLKDVISQHQDGLRICPNFSVTGFVFFGVPLDVPTGYLSNLTFSDFDNDGHVDIAGTNSFGSDSGRFIIIRNKNPKGSLTSNNFVQEYTKLLTYYPYFMTASDLNNDGTNDLMIGSYGKNYFSILKNSSHPGTFAFDEIFVPDATRGRFARYAVHDLNQDGRKDIVMHSPYETGNMAILENKTTSADITMAPPVAFMSEFVKSAIQPADMNGDGRVDLIVGMNNRTFMFLENKVGASEQLSNSSFEKNGEYGMQLVNVGSGTVTPQIIVNDLNGDGRPDVINAYSYNFGPHDGYNMEIWQNVRANCIDPSVISLNVSNTSATVILPPNTTIDQFQIEYRIAGNNNYAWNDVTSTTFYLYAGYSYQMRVRAKCYLGYTDYYYVDFTTDCADLNSLSVINIGVDKATLTAYNLSSLQIQYSPAGKGQWIEVPQYVSQISNLLPGTTYDLRFKGRCYTPTAFSKYKQFTTLCPNLSAITITNLTYNKAVVSSTSSYAGNAILEYSSDNVNWTLIDETRTMFPLIPGTQYFVRGRLACTNINSDFIKTSFITHCPKASMLSANAITPFSATINWADESNTGNYTLTYSVLGSSTITTVETSSTSFELQGLSPGTPYTVNVAPHCIRPKDFTSIVFNTVCYVPFDLAVNAITHTTAELSWADNFRALPYSVDYSISGSNVWLTTETEQRHVLLDKLRPGTEYEVKVHINCISETAPHVSVLFETDLYEETTLSPNPTTSKVTIHPSTNLIGNRFIMHDEAGRIIADGELRDYTIDLSDFSPGIYILKIDGDKSVKIFKK